jgi:translation initiation factor 2B subunit (eIF-2B alpha/beta/delta family)
MEVRQNEQSMHRVQKALRRLSPSEASLPSVRRYFLRSVFEEKAENRAHRFKETAARLRLVLRSEDAEFDMR